MKKLIALFIVALCAPLMAQTTAPTTITPQEANLGKGKVVGLDEFFNHQLRNGQPFHYIWEDTTINGYSKFGDVWKAFGSDISSLKTAPTRDDLNKLSIYFFCNPTPATSKYVAPGGPNYMTEADADVVAGWVKDGGVLCLFANDKNNCEFDHFNILCQKFGIKFNGDLRNEVPNARDRSPGTFKAAQYNGVDFLKGVSMVYMKEISTITVSDPATALFTDGKDVIMATAHYGKGFVFAVGDPWFYNEYIDVASTPGLTLENRHAAEGFCRWILPMASSPMAK